VEVRFEPGGAVWRGRRGARLYDIALEAGQRVASACGGTGICGRCGLRVVEGTSSLSPEGRRERRRKADNRVDPELRLACLTAVRGDLVVTADYW
jgi:uncharacterized 2Fe-2S/4Fe-4S cluster protein (DUF4445 family)